MRRADAARGCPDWVGLVARRADRDDSLGGAWEGALAHLDGGCGACRDRALAADPLLAFRRLPTVEATPAEIDSMRVAVRALRRTGELVGRGGGRGLPRPARLAAAACLLALLGLTVGGSRIEPPAAPALPQSLAEPASSPLVEGLDRPGARVYQLRQDDLAVVMIVDASLDV